MFKPSITVSIMPTYDCHNNCEYCYLNNIRNIVSPVHLYVTRVQAALEEISKKYTIRNIEMYGGDLKLFDRYRIQFLIDTCLLYTDDLKLTVNDLDYMRREFPKLKVKNYNISFNLERPDMLNALRTISRFPDIGVITVITKKMSTTPVRELLDYYASAGLRGSVTFIQESNMGKTQYMSNYEYNVFMIGLYEEYLNNREEYPFNITNLLILKDVVNKRYSVDMSNNIFIDPQARYCCIDFDYDGTEYFRQFNTLKEWEERCEMEKCERIEHCGTCTYFNMCYAEHFKRPNQYSLKSKLIGDICNGNFPQVKWALERKEWI